MRMIQVHKVWSLNVSASQILRCKISLLAFTETERFVNKFDIHVSSLLTS